MEDEGGGVRNGSSPARLSRLIRRAEQLLTAAADNPVAKYCAGITQSTRTLTGKLQEIQRLESKYAVYDRPIRRILAGAERALSLADVLFKGSSNILPALSEASEALDHSVEEIAWLAKMLTMPRSRVDTIPAPTWIGRQLSTVWCSVLSLHIGKPVDRAVAAVELSAHAQLPESLLHIIEEDAVPPLVQLLEDGDAYGRWKAATALAVIARDNKLGVEAVVKAGGCAVLVRRLAVDAQAELPFDVMYALITAVQAVSMMARTEPSCRNHFDLHSLVNLLVGHLQNHSHCHCHGKGARDDGEDAEMKARLKSVAALALSRLATGSEPVCKLIVDSGAVPLFVALLDGSAGNMRLYSGRVLIEIATFMPRSPPAGLVMEQLLKVVQCGYPKEELLLPSIAALGCLVPTGESTRVIQVLVELLDVEQPPSVAREAATALVKLVSEHHWHVMYSKAVVEAGGAPHVVKLVYSSDEAQQEAVKLLCYLALHVPERPEMAEAGVLGVLLWAKEADLATESPVKALLADTIDLLRLMLSPSPEAK